MIAAAAAIFALMLRAPLFTLTVSGDVAFAHLLIFPDEQDLRNATQKFSVRFLSNLATGLTLTEIAGCLWMLFSYKNRRSQMRTATILTVGALIIPVVAYGAVSLFIPEKNLSINYRMGWTLFLPIPAAIFILTARRNIAKDDAKIRSMNRFW
jgi:hypothetical protein